MGEGYHRASVRAPDDPVAAFEDEKARRIASYRSQEHWREASLAWLREAFEQRYMYHFAWLGRPIIQIPIDMVAVQEIVWSVGPDLIVETGIAHGGSLMLSASLLALLDFCDAAVQGVACDPRRSRRRVLGIDVDIRRHNRELIEAHPLAHLVTTIEGSSIDPATVAQVRAVAAGHQRVLVILDSNHTHEHVLAELEAYAPLVSVGSYCIVFDTVVEDLPAGVFPDRPFGPGNNPKTAVHEYVRRTAGGSGPRFALDHDLEAKLLITSAPDGFLRRVG
jgi:cephalosporin hydroxylase